MALEDAVTLGLAVAQHKDDLLAAFKLYESLRIPRSARVLWSTREMGRIYHAKGVERAVRNSLWQGRSQQSFYDALQWLYGWNAENCMSGIRL
jgi:3-hydroxybenzoate 6-monooxygenase